MARFEWTESPDGQRFINPYNFVSLGADVLREQPTDGALSGKIKVSLIVKTPLAIPDTESVQTDNIGHKTFSFFRVNDKPMIPGSQLRGMLRSAYEALSNSCLSVNNNNILSARHANPGRPGLIQFKDGAWHLYDARTFKDRGQELNKDSDVRRTWYCFETFVRDKKGKKRRLKPDERLKTKIFRNSGIEVKNVVNFDRAVENYLETIEIFDTQKGGANLFHQLKADLTYGIRKDEGLYPVFYETVISNSSTYVYLSPSQVSRYVFDNRLNQLLGTHKSCAKFNFDEERNENIEEIEDSKKTMVLCRACSLFGTISEGRRRSYAGKLRFSDAQIVEFEPMGKVTLKELASPKPTAVEFYTFKPDGALYWTYDYKVTSYKRIDLGRDKNGRNQTQIIPQKEDCEVVLRGRKFYFHNPQLERTDYQTNNRTKRNTTMELCKPESRFTFEIYFERITEEQLRELLWTITIGENKENGIQMHKLGHGKSLGLGSVKLVVEDVETRSFDAEALSYRVERFSKEQLADWLATVPFDTNGQPYKEFMRLTRYDNLSETLKKNKVEICYPIADEGTNSPNAKASHQWFIANRSMGEKGKAMAWSVKYTLPAVDEDPTLPSMKRKDTRIKPKTFK